MKFAKYIELSSTDEKEATFRSLSVGIVSDTNHKELSKEMLEKVGLDTSILERIERYNKQMRRLKTKCELGFVIEKTDPNNINTKRKERILSWIDKLDDEFAIIQGEFESKIREPNS